jgi:hypothetical protein
MVEGYSRSRAVDAFYAYATRSKHSCCYKTVRTADDADRAIAWFLQSTYDAVADLAGWDLSTFECDPDRLAQLSTQPQHMQLDPSGRTRFSECPACGRCKTHIAAVRRYYEWGAALYLSTSTRRIAYQQG